MMTNRLFQDHPDVVTVPELCKMLHIGRNTAYRLLGSGELKSVRIGKKYVIPTLWLEEYLKQQKQN